MDQNMIICMQKSTDVENTQRYGKTTNPSPSAEVIVYHQVIPRSGPC